MLTSGSELADEPGSTLTPSQCLTKDMEVRAHQKQNEWVTKKILILKQNDTNQKNQDTVARIQEGTEVKFSQQTGSIKKVL